MAGAGNSHIVGKCCITELPQSQQLPLKGGGTEYSASRTVFLGPKTLFLIGQFSTWGDPGRLSPPLTCGLMQFVCIPSLQPLRVTVSGHTDEIVVVRTRLGASQAEGPQRVEPRLGSGGSSNTSLWREDILDQG